MTIDYNIEEWNILPREAVEEFLLLRERTELLEESLGYLTEKERGVLNLYFGLNGYGPLPLSEIGYVVHLSGNRVRQIKEKALAKLRGDVPRSEVPNHLIVLLEESWRT